MKNLLFLSLLIISLGLLAQSDKRELMEELKADYIQQKLHLTDSENERFLTIYKEFEEKKKALRKSNNAEKRANMKKARSEGESDLTESEAKEVLMQRISAKQEMINLEKTYMNKMIEALSAKLVLEYYQAEKDFKKELLEMLKDDRPRHEMREELLQRRNRRN